MNNNIDFYNQNASWYENHIIGVDITPDIDYFLSKIPVGGKILDGGCGTGRDSLIMLEAGYNVVAFDGSTEMAKIASNNTGLDVRVETFEDICLEPNSFDGIWCMASLLHVDNANMQRVFDKLYNALIPGGFFYCSFKLRDKNFEKNGRTFTCYNEQTFYELISKTAFIVDEICIRTDKRDSWIYAFLFKTK